MRVLGIDPGTATTGYGVVDSSAAGDRALSFGVILTAADLPLERRLLAIFGRLSELLAEFRPEACAVEELFFGKNTRSAFSVAQARGVALLAAAQHGLAVEVYRPIQVKQAVASYGGASKQQVQQMVRMLLGLAEVPRPDDAADALAIALCHAHSYEALARRRAAEERLRLAALA
jgi:crossover junction endodeoxyribonuclease RuvC